MLNALNPRALEELLGDVQDGGPGVVGLHGDSLSIDRSVVKEPRLFFGIGRVDRIRYPREASSLNACRPARPVGGIRIDDFTLGETANDMRAWMIAACFGLASLSTAFGQGPSMAEPPRMVLVELYTSQGCDMCPEAERVLGAVAGEESPSRADRLPRRLLQRPLEGPVLRQAPQRAPGGLQPALHQAQEPRVRSLLHAHGHGRRRPVGERPRPRGHPGGRPPGAGEEAAGIARCEAGAQGRSQFRRRPDQPRTAVVEDRRREVLVCAVLTDDRVVTEIGSGENANKTLTARFPARSTRFEFTRLDGPKELSFSFRLDPSWTAEKLGIAAFAQDRKSGEVYQSALVPWAPRASDRERAQARPVVIR